jgi:AcrR family transcriptional regulator
MATTRSVSSSRPRPGPRPRGGGPAGPDEVRRAVLDAAADLFARCRVDNVSLRQIPAAAGVQLSLISRYIGTREQLIDTVLADLTRAVATQVLDHPTEQISFERDSTTGRWTRLLAYRALAGENLAASIEFNPVRAVADMAQHEYGLDPAAAQLRGTQVVASALGWRLFEEYLVGAADGLADEPVDVLRDELTRLHRRMAATPYPSPPDPPRRTGSVDRRAPKTRKKRS